MAQVTTLKQHLVHALQLGIEYEEDLACKAIKANNEALAKARAQRASVLQRAQRRVALRTFSTAA